MQEEEAEGYTFSNELASGLLAGDAMIVLAVATQRWQWHMLVRAALHLVLHVPIVDTFTGLVLLEHELVDVLLTLLMSEDALAIRASGLLE
jgi:hypothetical protein